MQNKCVTTVIIREEEWLKREIVAIRTDRCMLEDFVLSVIKFFIIMWENRSLWGMRISKFSIIILALKMEKILC